CVPACARLTSNVCHSTFGGSLSVSSAGWGVVNQPTPLLPDRLQQEVHVLPAQAVIDTARPKCSLPLDLCPRKKDSPVFLQGVQQPAGQVARPYVIATGGCHSR